MGFLNGSYDDRKIKVSFVPAGTVYYCYMHSQCVYTNTEKQIAVDMYGNYYRYDKTYGDLMSLYCEVAPVYDSLPTYDANNSVELSLYY